MCLKLKKNMNDARFLIEGVQNDSGKYFFNEFEIDNYQLFIDIFKDNGLDYHEFVKKENKQPEYQHATAWERILAALIHIENK